MLDQSIWWFSFFMACCERIARLHSHMKKSGRQRAAAVIWNTVLPDVTDNLSVTPTNQGKRQRTAKPGCGTHKIPNCQCLTHNCSSLEKTINSWGEFTNKINGNADSCFDCTWQLLLIPCRPPSAQSPFEHYRGRDPSCDCHTPRGHWQPLHCLT